MTKAIHTAAEFKAACKSSDGYKAELHTALDREAALILACTGLIKDLMLLDPEANKYLSVTVAKEAMNRADADFSEVSQG